LFYILGENIVPMEVKRVNSFRSLNWDLSPKVLTTALNPREFRSYSRYLMVVSSAHIWFQY